MKLFRRKPEYALAMPTNRGEDYPPLEIAVQPCDESGKPTTSHLGFMSSDVFESMYVPARGRPKSKTKAAAKVRNGPTKTKTEKVKNAVNLSEIP